jgi:phosphorylase kinase alpha/beta subunit
VRDRMLTQEIIIYLGLLIKSEPELLKGLLTLRVGYLILSIASELAREANITQDEAYEKLMSLSPYDIQGRLHRVLKGNPGTNNLIFQQESLHLNRSQQQIEWSVTVANPETQIDLSTIDWRLYRRQGGIVDRVDRDFYPSIWRLLEHCKGITIGDKLEKRNRLDSDLILSEMTPGEKNFALRIEHLLNKINAPEYRQLNIEALTALATFSERNPELKIEEYIVLDVSIGHAVRLAWKDFDISKVAPTVIEYIGIDARDLQAIGNGSAFHPANYDRYKSLAWSAFYQTAPSICASYIVKSIQFLSEIAV